MNLFTKLKQRGEEGNPIKVGLIGGGKFGTMFLSQVLRLPGIHVVGIADLSPAAVRSNLELLGWPAELYSAPTINDAAQKGKTYITDDWHDLTKQPDIEIIAQRADGLSTKARFNLVQLDWDHVAFDELAFD